MLGFVFARNRNPELFISVIWAVWNRRNNLRLGNPVVSLSQLLQLARDRQLERATLSVSSPTNRPQHLPSSWTPPATPCYKVKFDGATFAADGSAGLGVIIRNGDGQVMALLSQLILLPLTVIKVEALAA